MADTMVIVACAECRTRWDATAAPLCNDPSHTHRRFELHRHRSTVVLPEGTEVTAVSFDASDPYARPRTPSFGLYLDRRWQPPWPHQHVDWPDFGVPVDPSSLVAALRSVLERAQAGERVELGCVGGHGRTGTALACLAVLCGLPTRDAVNWVRANYCFAAIETPEQEAFVAALEG
jgi:hypothetical protein